MPEGDTVWRACRHLNQALAGQQVLESDFRVPALANADLRGATVLEVVARGKHQLFRFDDGSASGLTLHTQFKMDGTWHLLTAGNTARVRRAVGYRLPVVELVPTAEEHTVVGHLGPDLLGPGWDGEEALRRLRADPGAAIGEALLDQRNLAGIGTLYRAETLFLSGVHPRRPVAEVADLPGVVERARRLLHANRERPEQVTTGDRRRGHEHWVFNRERRPCRRCGTPIRAEEFGPLGKEHRSLWCPRGQPG